MISVCIATYNGEKFIEDQVRSILQQLSDDDEIIISDDYSDDLTISIIDKFNDKRIKIIYNQKKRKMNHPAISNFENALSNAKGDYIFLADQDDVWIQDKISTTIPYLNEYDMVVSDCILTDSLGIVTTKSFFEFNKSSKGFVNNLMKNNYIGCCMAFNRLILKKALPFPDDIPLHDLWLGFVSELFYKTIFINEKLVYYRRHENVTSYTGGKSGYSLIKKMSFRINCIKYVPLIFFR
jgi:glycosyltransferase involved in cell wall biosynthesis